MKHELVKTADGSFTLRVAEMDEHYHSTHGAIQEAKHVFIDSGLNFMPQQELSIFELGFGTGLNAFLTLKEVDGSQRLIHYIGVELNPIPPEFVSALNYAEGLENQTLFERLHASPWGIENQITPNFHLHKWNGSVLDFVGAEQFHLIYYDAFGFRAQPEMWTPELLKKMYDLLFMGGALVTYAARGQLKRDLKALGFTVEVLQGPPGKREMIRAIKS